MRLIIILLAVTCFPIVMSAQKEDLSVIPQNILASFSSRYPNTKVKKWRSLKGVFVAKFLLDGKKCMAYYSPEGDWIKTESKIKWTWDLPVQVKTGWKKCEYNRWYVESIKIIETREQPLYEMQVNNGTTLDADHYSNFIEKYLLYFTGAGELIRKEKCKD